MRKTALLLLGPSVGNPHEQLGHPQPPSITHRAITAHFPFAPFSIEAKFKYSINKRISNFEMIHFVSLIYCSSLRIKSVNTWAQYNSIFCWCFENIHKKLVKDTIIYNYIFLLKDVEFWVKNMRIRKNYLLF